MRALDTNQDGELDQSELDLAVANLRKLDTNKDGKVSQEELGRGRGGSSRPDQPGTRSDRPRFQLPVFADLDKSGDEKLSKEELPERMQQRFDQMDRNGDGVIDKEEWETVMNFIRERMRNAGNNPQRRPDRGGGEGGSERPKRPALDDE